MRKAITLVLMAIVLIVSVAFAHITHAGTIQQTWAKNAQGTSMWTKRINVSSRQFSQSI